MDRKFVAFLVAFLCIFAANNSEGNNRKFAHDTFLLDNGAFWDVPKIDENIKAEQVWNECRKHLEQDNTEIIKDLDLSQSVETSIQKAISDLPSNKKDAFLECLKEKNFPLQLPNDEQETPFTKYQNLLSSWVSIPRRYLRLRGRGRGKGRIRGIRNSVSLSPDSSPPNIAPAPTEEQQSSPAPSPTPVLSPPERTPVLSPPKRAPVPSPPKRTPVPSPHLDTFDFFAPSNAPANVSPVSPSEFFGINKKYIVAAAASSATVVFLFMFILLICCLRKKRNRVEPKDGQRDEKPLLNFSASDISAGSSQKSQANGNLTGKDLKAVGSIALATKLDSSQLVETQAVAKTDSNLPLPPGKTAPAPAPPPPPPPPKPQGPPPPPPKPPSPAPPPLPKSTRPPPNPPKFSPLGPHRRRQSSTGDASETGDESEAPKTKLKPFFWDKVLANPDHSMVWHEIKAGSFQFDEEMMKSLFGYVPTDKNKNEIGSTSSSFDSLPQLIQIIDPKKSQNLAILLKALNVTTEEVCDALREGNELPAEFIQTLLKMAPTSDEELKLRLFCGDVSQLGPAERFLKVMVDIPFAFKRLECLLFVSTFQEELPLMKESFSTLEVACKELRNSRLFLKLLEAVLKTGNRMNDGTYRGGAQAFKLDTLLKLSDVKGIDGKTTLLHFVVQEIIRSEGVRAARRLKASRSMSSVKTEDLIEDFQHETEEYHRSLGLQVVSGLSTELENVRKAALIDNQSLSESVSKLGLTLSATSEFLEKEMKGAGEDGSEFYDALSNFIHQSKTDVKWLTEEEKRIMGLVKSTGDYFHGKAGPEEALHLFVIVRDFLVMLDKACKDVKSSTKLPSKAPKKEVMAASSPSQESPSEELPSSPSQESLHESPLDTHRRLFPALRERQMDDDFSSDDES